MLSRILIGLCLIAIILGQPRAAESIQPAKEKPALRFWKDVPDQAEVVAATFLGGKGHEWLVGGGFQADGTIVLVGNVRGPVFDMPVPEKVIGTDLDKPAEPKPVPVLERGQPKTDKAGAPIMEPPSWRHDGVTGFVVHCTADLKKILAVHRLPWASAALTSAAVGPDGAIYLCGRATDQIARLGGDVQELTVSPDAVRKEGRCPHAFVARLSANGEKAQWVRHAKGLCDAPQVAVNPDGSLRFSAQEVRTFDKTGKAIATVVVPGGVHKTTSVSPVDGSIVVGGEHHWRTGREPWRCPILNVHAPDGKLRTQLYDWGGPYVGLDNCRQVSDTAIRWVTHEPDGSILIYAWSDGGNSVMTNLPVDIRRNVDHKGLGITAAGAGVLSCGYVVRIEPKNYTVRASTIWLAFLPNGKPNSVWIDNLATTPDSSIAIAGRSAFGLWQTKNKLSDAEPSGPYVAVLDSKLTGVRYCSVIPGTGVAEVSYDNTAWGIASGRVNGKTRVLFVGSASPGKAGSETPTANALQKTFGGGWCDGFALLLDLPAAPEETRPPAPVPAAVPSPNLLASFDQAAPGLNTKYPPRYPEDDRAFHFKPEYPPWVTVDAEFRDRLGNTWPNFLYGKTVEGSLIYKDKRLAGTITVDCTTPCQPLGDQDRRVLGELYKDKETPQLRLTLQSFGELKSVMLKTVGKDGKEGSRTVEYCDAKGVLILASRKIEVSPRVTYRFSGPKDGPLDKVQVTAWITLKAGELGLATPGKDTDIDVRISMGGTTLTQAPPKQN